MSARLLMVMRLLYWALETLMDARYLEIPLTAP